MRNSSILVLTVFSCLATSTSDRSCRAAESADTILHSGKVITVDRGFTTASAVAIRDGSIIAVGSDHDVLEHRGPATKVVDLAGKCVLPGLIDSHTHPLGACLTEFDHAIPTMRSIPDVLEYIKERARVLGPGKWVIVRQVFITRLAERRYPTRTELDAAAPRNPVLFSTGPDAALNSEALRLSGIDANFVVDGPGMIEKDPKTGEPTGILRNCTRYVKSVDPGKSADSAEQERRLLELIRDYNAVGITGIIDRNASAGAIDLYRKLRDRRRLDVRIAISHAVDHSGPLETVLERIEKVARHPLRAANDWVRIIGIKMFLDGGMLTGSAYMTRPWGVSAIYSIDDPAYRGVLFIPPERLEPMVRATVRAGLQFTAHSVGDAAVEHLLDAYEAANREAPVAPTRPCLTHSNFMSARSIERAARMGIVADIQPAWLHLDAGTLHAQFGEERLRWFQPLRSLFEAGVVVGGGSDHMQKIGSFRSINPYNPFLGMETAVRRTSPGHDRPLHPEEAITREQAIRFYTMNNAKLMFLEDRVGSIEVGKRADLIVLDRDPLTCPVEEIHATRVLATYIDGRAIEGLRAVDQP
ncbi:MAG: amidohydrolase [Isosphaeraceae bacterium]|nr:amidohydrolase [Isosphaeraceae bacterium]